MLMISFSLRMMTTNRAAAAVIVFSGCSFLHELSRSHRIQHFVGGGNISFLLEKEMERGMSFNEKIVSPISACVPPVAGDRNFVIYPVVGLCLHRQPNRLLLSLPRSHRHKHTYTQGNLA